MTDIKTPSTEATYEDVAGEYYDAIRHPTCANLLDTSHALLRDWMGCGQASSGWLCEIGPGQSALAPAVAEAGGDLRRVVLVDASWSMLACTGRWARCGVRLVQGDARQLPFTDASFALVLASLGDPYNDEYFWCEVSRVARPGAALFFTTPSHDWALAYRGEGDDLGVLTAEFELAGGRRVRVPSRILSTSAQRSLIEASGLVVEEVREVPVSALDPGQRSPKLVARRGQAASVLTGYRISKPSRLTSIGASPA